METKKCPRCKRTLPIDQFGNCKMYWDGKNLYCKECIWNYHQKSNHNGYYKKYYQNHKTEIDNKRIEYRKKNKEKIKAQNQAKYAVKIGKIEKPSVCSKCQRKRGIEAHHEDYSKPFEIIWLCKSCHLAIHRKPCL